MKRRQSKPEAAISDEMMAYQHEFVGRGPDRIRTRIVEDLVIVRSFGVRTPAERQLATSFEGRRLIKAMRQQVLEAARSWRESSTSIRSGGHLRSLGHLHQEWRMARRLRARSYYGGGIAVTNEHSLLRRFLFGSDPSRVWREEKVLRYIIHRIDEDAELHEVLEEPYVQRNCSQIEIDEIRSNPDLVHACREHLEQTFRSGELDPRRHRTPGK